MLSDCSQLPGLSLWFMAVYVSNLWLFCLPLICPVYPCRMRCWRKAKNTLSCCTPGEAALGPSHRCRSQPDPTPPPLATPHSRQTRPHRFQAFLPSHTTPHFWSALLQQLLTLSGLKPLSVNLFTSRWNVTNSLTELKFMRKPWRSLSLRSRNWWILCTSR